MDQNRVLTLEEVKALTCDDSAWFDERVSSPYNGGEGAGPIDEDDTTDYGKVFRCWLREPTPDELAANPWPEVG